MRKAPHPLKSPVRGNSLVVQRLEVLPSTAAVTGSSMVGELGSYNVHCGIKKKKKSINYQVTEWKLCLCVA